MNPVISFILSLVVRLIGSTIIALGVVGFSSHGWLVCLVGVGLGAVVIWLGIRIGARRDGTRAVR